MTGINTTVIASNSEAISASFTYDALGRRASKTINGITTEYIYDGNDIISEISGGVVGATYLRSLNIDEPFVRQAGTNEYYHTDALGSVLGLTADNGQLTTTYRYDPFGNTTMVGTSSNPFQYTGRENDQPDLSGAEGGLYYYRNRYYSPILERFISQDPIRPPMPPLPLELQNVTLCSRNADSVGPFLLAAFFQEPQRAHPYLYINNNPLRTGDPLGFGPPSECEIYILDCTQNAFNWGPFGLASYACAAQVVCTQTGDSTKMNCRRNCLIKEYKKGCTGWACQFIYNSESGAGGAHGKCFSCCDGSGGRKDGNCGGGAGGGGEGSGSDGS